MLDKKNYIILPPVLGEFIYLEFAPIVNAGYLMPEFTKYADLIKDIENFFVKAGNDGSFLYNQELEFFAQEYINSENILTADLLFCAPELFDESFAFPVFSKRFVERLQTQLEQEIEFYPCKVICENVKYDFFIGKIMKYLPFIDINKTEYNLDKEGNKKSTGINFYNCDTFNDNKFLIARDKEFKESFFVSEEFKNLIENNDLNIDFMEFNPSYFNEMFKKNSF